MLAVSAERTRMHSRPSRNTSTAMSSVAETREEFGVVGSGLPEAVTPCQTKTAATASAERARSTGIPRQGLRTLFAGVAKIVAGVGEMLFTLTLMTSRPRLTKTQYNSDSCS